MADCAMKYIHGTKTATTKGHLNQKQQGTRSTGMDDNPVQKPGNMKTNQVFIAMAHMAGKIYSDWIRLFPIQSSCGNKYIVIVYIYNANAILSHLIKNWSTGELLHVFHNMSDKLHAACFKQQLHKWDNNSSAALEMFITNDNTALQFISPKMHRQTQLSKLYKHGSAILRQD